MSLIAHDDAAPEALRRETLEALRHRDMIQRERAELQSIVDGSRDAIWSWGPDGRITRWNAQAQTLFGYAPEEIIGRSLMVLIPRDRQEMAERVINSVGAGASYPQIETIRVRKDGVPVEVELTVSPMIASDGTITGAATICRPTGDRRAAEAALALRMRELTTISELSERLQLARNLQETYEPALDAIVAALECDRASILLFDTSGVMRFVAWRGLSDSYRCAVDGHSPWQAGTKGAEPICIEDIRRSDVSPALKETIACEGIGGLAFIPLITDGRLIGKFMTYYPTPHAFTEHEVNLASTIARQLALAVSRKLAEQQLRESEARFRLMSEHAPVMIWMSGPHGECLHLNGMLRQFWGVDESSIGDFDWRTTMHPEDAPEIVRQMSEALAARTPVAIKGRYREASGGYRILQTNARPRFSSAGDFLGLIGINVDVTEQEQSERALRDSERRFRLAVEASPSGMVMTDGEGRIILVNEQAEKLFGYKREEIIGQKTEVLVPERFRAQHPVLRSGYRTQASARPMGAGRELFARRKDGTEVPVEIGLSPIETADGAMAMAAVVDISARKRAEADRELLVAELNHRVKNTLAIVQGIAHQTFRTSQAPVELRGSFEGRLVALANAHNLLTESNWENASLEDLAAVTLESRAANAARVSLSGPPIRLPAKQALSLAMALHELSTNAKKYGALSNETGRIAVDWAVNDKWDVLTFRWRESGGPSVSPPNRKGFGTVLLERTLAHDLEGEVAVSFDPGGLSCIVTMPLSGGSVAR